MMCKGCVYRAASTTEDVLRCADCSRAYQEWEQGYHFGIDKYEEDQSLKQCWDCKNLETDYPECNSKSLNVILDLTLEQTCKCTDFVRR